MALALGTGGPFTLAAFCLLAGPGSSVMTNISASDSVNSARSLTLSQVGAKSTPLEFLNAANHQEVLECESNTLLVRVSQAK